MLLPSNSFRFILSFMFHRQQEYRCRNVSHLANHEKLRPLTATLHHHKSHQECHICTRTTKCINIYIIRGGTNNLLPNVSDVMYTWKTQQEVKCKCKCDAHCWDCTTPQWAQRKKTSITLSKNTYIEQFLRSVTLPSVGICVLYLLELSSCCG